MPAKEARTLTPDGSCDDMVLVSRALARDGAAFRAIMKRNNQRLYRIARAILRDDAEAEDVVQEAYLLAFSHLEAFRGGSSLTTWLSRITVNEALGRLRRGRRARGNGLALAAADAEAEIIPFPATADGADPERTMARRLMATPQARRCLENPLLAKTSLLRTNGPRPREAIRSEFSRKSEGSPRCRHLPTVPRKPRWRCALARQTDGCRKT